MATVTDWVEGARVRTLPAAAAPVILGASAAFHLGSLSIGKSLLALVVALSLQVGVNYSNDYSDGVRGTDEDRVGPPRLTGGGLAEPKTVLLAALGSFALAGLAGLALTIWAGLWWFVLIGAVAIIAAWFYTGGKNPYGYAGIGLSELLVFVFFGLVATVGTTYAQSYSAPAWLWIGASGLGAASVALLMINNVRDLEKDASAGKTTLAVRLGPIRARLSVAVLFFWSATLGGISAWGSGALGIWALALSVILVLAGLPVIMTVVTGARGAALLPALRNTGLYTLLYGVLVGVAIAVGAGPLA